MKILETNEFTIRCVVRLTSFYTEFSVYISYNKKRERVFVKRFGIHNSVIHNEM